MYLKTIIAIMLTLFIGKFQSPATEFVQPAIICFIVFLTYKIITIDNAFVFVEYFLSMNYFSIR